MKKEDNAIQEKAFQFQMLQNSLRGLQQKEHVLLSGVDELERTRLALEDLKDSKSSTAYIPLGANNFVLGEIKDSNNVLISVGAGIAVKKSREDAIKVAEDRLKEFRGETDKISQQIRKLSEELMKIQSEIESMRT